jgi:hypothetical protein
MSVPTCLGLVHNLTWQTAVWVFRDHMWVVHRDGEVRSLNSAGIPVPQVAKSAPEDALKEAEGVP